MQPGIYFLVFSKFEMQSTGNILLTVIVTCLELVLVHVSLQPLFQLVKCHRMRPASARKHYILRKYQHHHRHHHPHPLTLIILWFLLCIVLS